MERLKNGVVFWVLMLVTVCMPVSATTPVKKVLYKAQIKVSIPGVGASILQPTPSGYDVDVTTHAYPNSSVDKVALKIEGDNREIILCKNLDPVAGDCTYGPDGNLDLESSVNSSMLYLAGITGLEFRNALTSEHLIVVLSDGALGSGTYIRIF